MDGILTRNAVTGALGSSSAPTLPGDGSKSAITTAGAGTLTAASLVSGLIMRSGPTAAYNDTTATAAEIFAAVDKPQVGASFRFTHVNGVAFACTIVAGTGVTLAGTTANAASKVRVYHVEINSPTTATITGVGEMVA